MVSGLSPGPCPGRPGSFQELTTFKASSLRDDGLI
jgi:hypothetical protein